MNNKHHLNISINFPIPMAKPITKMQEYNIVLDYFDILYFSSS